MISCGMRQSSAPKRLAVLPVGGFAVTDYEESDDDQQRRACRKSAADLPFVSQRGSAPGDQNEQSNLRQISIAIRVRLAAHLDKPNHRYQNSEEPNPADEQKRIILSREEESAGNDE